MLSVAVRDLDAAMREGASANEMVDRVAGSLNMWRFYDEISDRGA